MKKIIFALLLALSANAYSQIEQPVATYDGDLYFIPAKLTSNGKAFMYSYKFDYDSGKTWFTIFDDEVNVVKQVEIDDKIINYTTRTIISKRRYYVPNNSNNGNNSGTRTTSSEFSDGYFLDEWTVTSDTTENMSIGNMWIEGPEVYEDNNNYHSRYMYLSQTLFNDDEDFEYLTPHYEIMPLTYCATDDKSGDNLSTDRPVIGGEECDSYITSITFGLNGSATTYTLIRKKVYGGVKHTGMDVVSLDGTIKKTLPGITSIGTVVAINGNYYVSAYDYSSSKYGLYKIATATTNLAKVADISAETGDNNTYNMSGIKVKADTKGIVIRNGKKILNK